MPETVHEMILNFCRMKFCYVIETVDISIEFEYLDKEKAICAMDEVIQSETTFCVNL